MLSQMVINMKMDDIIIRTIDKAIIMLGIVGSVLLGMASFYNLPVVRDIVFFVTGLVVSCAVIRVWLAPKISSKHDQI